MKKVLLIHLFLFLNFSVNAACSVDSTKGVKIILMNDNRSRPILTSKAFFWRSTHLSVITFTGELYTALIKYRVSENIKDSVFNNFSIAAALIFLDKGKSDTIYADCFFKNWLVKDETFYSSNDFLSKMLGPLYLGFYSDMKKGDD